MKKIMALVLAATLFFNSGCCSIFTSGPQAIAIDSQPQGAAVKIGPYKGKTPFTVSLPRGKDYVIVAKYGDKTETLTLEKSIEPVYWVNILFFPGLLIDLGTGKMWKYSPTEYDISFE